MDRVSSNVADMSRRAGDILRRINRFFDGPLTRKKLIIIVLVVIFLVLYVGPTLMSWMFNAGRKSNPKDICEANFLKPFEEAINEYDAYVRHENFKAFTVSSVSSSHNFMPYVGNGLFSLTIEPESPIYIKYGRTLSLPVPLKPLYVVDDTEMKEFSVADYKNGIINRYQCSDSGLQVSYQYYAHRTIPSLFVQEILLKNPTDSPQTVKLRKAGDDWLPLIKRDIQSDSKDYHVSTGMVSIPGENMVVVVSVVWRQLIETQTVDARSSLELLLLTTIQYSKPIKPQDYIKHKDVVEKKAIEEMKKASSLTSDRAAVRQLRMKHAQVWQNLWYTGFYISDSKVEGIINGDRINATIYAILSQVRSYEHEEHVKASMKSELLRTLAYSEGCYEGHSTLDAINLWKPLVTYQDTIDVASIWLLTLEKLGCHNLLKSGASGVNQAMILSFGAFRFSNQHLEYNIHPSKLHRDFLFRRINYGNMTHVNVSVIVQEDNKAAIFVALDRSDKSYYACDGGCLDSPVQLGPYRKYFPVKLTDPLTAILYVTADKQHMEDLRHAIHVQEVIEAPAHENHVIALHKHGHSLGGLNPLFWVSIICLIVVFHLFLCRIIMNEFCDTGVNYRRLYNKPNV